MKAAQLLVPPGHGMNWTGMGGFFICTVAASEGLPTRHLVASEEETELKYGPYIDVPGAASPIDGPANTAALLATGEPHPAAEWAAALTVDGHSDFHLPSQLDLMLARVHAPHRFNKDGVYQSSTQVSRDDAFVQDFEYGSSVWYSKGSKFRVRAFRWIHVAP